MANIAVWPLLCAIMLANACPTGPSTRPIRISGMASVAWPGAAKTVASPAWNVYLPLIELVSCMDRDGSAKVVMLSRHSITVKRAIRQAPAPRKCVVFQRKRIRTQPFEELHMKKLMAIAALLSLTIYCANADTGGNGNAR